MSNSLAGHLRNELDSIREQGLYKKERAIISAQDAAIKVRDDGVRTKVINLCANNYLGLSNHPSVIKAAHAALDQHGFGMSSVRFICGTQDIHKALEARISEFLGFDDAILYSSCFDANTGLFETLLGEEDAIVSDALNHASIIDGIRLCKAKRYRYANNDMQELEKCLRESQDQRFRLIATDGVFSMDGTYANLPAICDLAEQFDALVMVDDSHAVGFVGDHGRGTHEHWNVQDRVHIMTGTLGKALGGASGGYTVADKTIVDWLRQRSRPYLFSNSLAPPIVETSITVLEMLQQSVDLRERLDKNTVAFRKGLQALGFDLVEGSHPIIPIMLGDARLAQDMAQQLLTEGIYVIGFSYPVVPKGAARIRTQMSAALTTEHIERALAAFEKVGRQLKII
ncbi:MAG: glycine C-acetyltransferase [Gammaproteobacteria bacterium]|nr:glycine C-acetyltransferase [Gammaproteobacteria bacterium]